VEEDAKLYGSIEGAVAPTKFLEDWGFVTTALTLEGDPIYVNPKYYRGGVMAGSKPHK
jgi:hypothetical protein